MKRYVAKAVKEIGQGFGRHARMRSYRAGTREDRSAFRRRARTEWRKRLGKNWKAKGTAR